ncbi:class I SAM-dependent methyltransferase [Bradyrhizobium oligotrophicum]|uniref:class I SAM-dependent methyltransferase n=1 Tax=Bradyrhizobium oligotrophicum TaxID=44255 RepID=UPI003EBF6FAF
MQIYPIRLLEILEKHYSRSSHQLTRLIQRYSVIYDLPTIESSFRVPPEKLAQIIDNVGFVIVAAYDSDGRVAVKKLDPEAEAGFIDPTMFGCSVSNVSSFCLEDAASRIVFESIEAEVLELEPIAIVRNRFFQDDQSKAHYGIAFAALVGSSRTDASGIIWDHQSKAFAELRKSPLFEIVRDYVKDRKIPVPLSEATSGNRSFIKKLIHHHVIRPIIHTASSKIIRRRVKAYIDKCESYLDVSAGDDDFITEISEEYDPPLIVANDISWSAMRETRRKSSTHNYNIIFTNHNLCDLPYNTRFDVVLWKNTLHHVSSPEEMMHALDCVASVARRLIVVDIEDPHRSRRGRLWNRYYEKFYGDADDDHAFFTRSTFRNLLEAAFPGRRKRFESIRTVKGIYLLGVVDIDDDSQPFGLPTAASA